LPLSMSLKDFNSRRPRRDNALPRCELSINESTASWSMRFSFRTITSGAPSSSNLFSRLLRLITRRYRSFRSEVANRPPSNCTMGRKSGGITGRMVRIIHSGRLPDLRNASTTFKRLVAFFLFACFWTFEPHATILLPACPNQAGAEYRRMLPHPYLRGKPVPSGSLIRENGSHLER